MREQMREETEDGQVLEGKEGRKYSRRDENSNKEPTGVAYQSAQSWPHTFGGKHGVQISEEPEWS